MTFRRYAIALLCAALCLGIAAAAINVVIDPYGLFNWVRVEGVNAKKAYAYTHKHLAKQTRALRLSADDPSPDVDTVECERARRGSV